MTAPLAAVGLPWPSLRTLAAAAALAVALTGRGDLLFLGGLLALALADRRSSIAALVAVAAVAVRWGTTSLGTVTGVASTLGPGVRVGPPAAAAALALAAVSLLLAGLGAPLLPRMATTVAAAVVAVGPLGASSVGSVALGVLAAALAAAVAVLLPRWVPEPSDRVRVAAPVAAVAALGLAAIW